MKKLFLTLLLIVCLSTPVFAQTFYNPVELQFEDVNYSLAVTYRAEFLIVGTTIPIAFADVLVSRVTVASVGPPVVYSLLFEHIPVFLPFGKSYVVRLLRCDAAECGTPSEVTRETVRYTYCKGTSHSVQPTTITQAALPVGAVGKYVAISLATTSVRPVHAINISLVGAGTPAFYFTGNDMRGSIVLSVGPLPRAGRYLVNISVADEAGCSASQATQFLTIR